MITKLWLARLHDIKQQTAIDVVPFLLVHKLSKTPKGKINQLFFGVPLKVPNNQVVNIIYVLNIHCA